MWDFSGSGVLDPERTRTVEVRIDSPLNSIQKAIDVMRAGEWQLVHTPDADGDPHQRLFFRRTQSILDDQKREMFDHALRAARACGGRFHSWMIEEELGE
jgi:hypothetical protein